MQEVRIGEIRIGKGNPLVLIAGPCVLEDEALTLEIARELKKLCGELKIPLIFKASYEKDNRGSEKSYIGPGLQEGMRWLSKVKEKVGLPVLSDIHRMEDVNLAKQVLDVLQVPAFLCQQTSLLLKVGAAGRVVNIKKGQFVSPWDMRHAVEKVRSAGNDKVFVTERGSSFGYQNLVVDMRSLPVMREFAPVVFDATHSVQLPSAGKSDGQAVSSGQPQFIPVLARAAVAAGVDGVFIEVHDEPRQAKSDGPNALDLKKLRDVLRELLAVHRTVAGAT